MSMSWLAEWTMPLVPRDAGNGGVQGRCAFNQKDSLDFEVVDYF